LFQSPGKPKDLGPAISDGATPMTEQLPKIAAKTSMPKPTHLFLLRIIIFFPLLNV